MYKKILSSIFITSILMVIGALLCITIVLYFYFSNQQVKDLKNQMAYLKQGVEETGVNYFDNFKAPERITYINSKGEVLYDNSGLIPTENHLDRAEIKEALTNGEGSSTRYSYTLNENTVYYAQKLNNGDILRISVSQLSLAQLLLGLLQIYSFIIILVAIVSFFTSKNLTHTLLDPINNLDLDNINQGSSYPELLPLLNKINYQNEEIRKQLKEVIKQKADFKTITASMDEGVIVTDEKGLIKNINQAAYALLGIKKLKPEENIAQLNQLGSEFLQIFSKALDGNKEEITLKKSNKDLNIRVSPIISEENQTGVVIIILDITERVQRERLRSEYISNVSHELKTPLTSISGFAEIIKSGIAKAEDVNHFIDRIYEETQTLIRMVQDILTIGYLDEEGLTIEKKQVNLSFLTEEIFKRIRTKAKKKNISVELIQRGDSCIFGNEEILKEMIYNLIENAVKYNRDNGQVIVILDGTKNDSLLLQVKDTGVGIAETEQNRIFERFYRSDKSRSKSIEGTGLGLSIVKHAAAVHNAEVYLESVVDQGSAFKIRFNR